MKETGRGDSEGRAFGRVGSGGGGQRAGKQEGVREEEVDLMIVQVLFVVYWFASAACFRASAACFRASCPAYCFSSLSLVCA